MQKDKRFEFRKWQAKYRGGLLIHERKEIDKDLHKKSGITILYKLKYI